MQTISSKELISEVLSGNFETKQEVRLWQSTGDSRRVEFEGKCYRFDGLKKELWFSCQKGLDKVDFSFPIYGHISRRQLVFKAELLFCGDFKIVVSFPEKIKMNQIRSMPREDLLDRKEIIQYQFGSLSYGQHFTHSFSARLFNKSVGGIGLLVKGSEVNKFYDGDYISIKNSLGEVQRAQIRHKTLINPGSFPGHYQIGLCYIN